MYHAHFGLERGMFGEGIAADTAVFRTARHDRLIAHFKLALGSASSAVALRGPAGVGKTTLTSAALRTTSTRLALAWLGGTATNPAELLELILVELGVNTLRTSRIERVQLWRQFQAEIRATDSRLFLVVERTEDLSAEVLHSLDQLTAPDAGGNPGANLLLLGNEGLDAHLAAPLLDSLRQRIRLRAVLDPFSEAELQDYLRHQTACAGGSYDRIFAPGAVAALFRYSRGIARLVNNLCESALDVAAVQQHKQVTAELVARTAVSLIGLPEPVPVPRTTGTALPEPAAPNERRAAPRPPALAPAPLESRPAAVPAEPRAAAFAPAEPIAPAPALLRVEPVPAPIAAIPPPPPPAPAALDVPAAPTPAAAKPAEVEFDGGATDVTDVALIDFPVLTDAVDPPAAAAPKPAVSAALPAAASSRPQAPLATPSPPVAAAKPALARPASRIETAYTATRPPSPALAAAALAAAAQPPTPPPRSAPAPAKPVVAAAPQADADGDELRQTQTMRAISVAKSIDDISSSMAETLFSDAELDLVTAALAAEWPDEADEAAAAPPAPPPKPGSARTLPADDPFDLFGLGEDAPLELIDDSAQPPTDRPQKTASR